MRRLFRPELIAYPEKSDSIPLEVEAHRRLVASVLHRAVEPGEILPVLHPTWRQ